MADEVINPCEAGALVVEVDVLARHCRYETYCGRENCTKGGIMGANLDLDPTLVTEEQFMEMVPGVQPIIAAGARRLCQQRAAEGRTPDIPQVD